VFEAIDSAVIVDGIAGFEVPVITQSKRMRLVLGCWSTPRHREVD
jgi:hypothetical protein